MLKLNHNPINIHRNSAIATPSGPSPVTVATIRAFIVPYLLQDDVSQSDRVRVTHHYDRFYNADRDLHVRSQRIEQLLEQTSVVTIPHLIVGSGDIATTLWLERYKDQHRTTDTCLNEHRLPSILMIGGRNFGNWKNDYLLAQNQRSLERHHAINPSHYVSEQEYERDAYVNARHLYQANIRNLADTQAPVLKRWNALKIEKKENHLQDWENHSVSYRVVIAQDNIQKAIYTANIGVCTGFGHTTNTLVPNIIGRQDFERLNRYDEQKGFTPIIDGNRFILKQSEEGSPGRIIAFYGGGGTATAGFRKGFFGRDVQTQERPYLPAFQQNHVFLIAKSGFSAAGNGKLVQDVLRNARALGVQFDDELITVEETPNGTLQLAFSSGKTVQCDQFVYCLGQVDELLQEMIREIASDLSTSIDQDSTPLSVCTSDDRVHFFAGAALNTGDASFAKKTTKWLQESNVGADIVAATLGSSRAQIKKFAVNHGVPIQGVNANTDDPALIHQLFLRARVEARIASDITSDLIMARTYSTAGFTRSMLQTILEAHGITHQVHIYGHTNLVLPPRSRL